MPLCNTCYLKTIFASRRYAQRSLCRSVVPVCLPVCPSVRLSHSFIVSKRVNMTSTFPPSGTPSFQFFYRAMLCIAQTMLSQNVRLSMRLSFCLSVTRRYFIETAKHIINFFYVVRQPHHSSCSKRYSNIPTGTPNGGFEYRWGMKNCYCRPTSRLISETIQDRAIVTMGCEQETVPKLSNGTIFNDLGRPLTHFKVTPRR